MPPSTLKTHYKISNRDEVLSTMAGALEAFTNASVNLKRYSINPCCVGYISR